MRKKDNPGSPGWWWIPILLIGATPLILAGGVILAWEGFKAILKK